MNDGVGLDMSNIVFSEIPCRRNWSVPVPLAISSSAHGTTKLPRKLKKKLKKLKHGISIEVTRNDDMAAFQHMHARHQLAQSQRDRAADLCAHIRRELDGSLSARIPGVLTKAEVMRVLAQVVTDLKPHAVDSDVRVEQDKDNPSEYHFNYKLNVVAPPVYTVSITKPDNISDEEWQKWCRDAQDAVNQANAEAEQDSAETPCT